MHSGGAHKGTAFRPGAHDPTISPGAGAESWEEKYDYKDPPSRPDINETHSMTCWSPEQGGMTGTLNPRMLEDFTFQESLPGHEHQKYAANSSSYRPPPCSIEDVTQDL
ncbi:Fc.00g024700.m01.CDS01 [Cosmosporella sp. VM-42]